MVPAPPEEYTKALKASGIVKTKLQRSMRRATRQAVVLLLATGAQGLFPAMGVAADAVRAFVGARIIDGTGKTAEEKATLLVRDGRIEAVGPSVKVPAGAQRIDAAGKTIIPGLINAHGHVNDRSQLSVYARYGVTSVFSLGGDNELKLRDQTRREQQTPALTRARLYIAGPIPVSKTPEEGRKAVDAIAAAKTDIVKIRIDDQLGTATPMPPEVYTAIIEEAHAKGMRMAVHIVKLADATAVLRLGADYIAHSVRDRELDGETIALLKKNNAFYTPTLMREVSTFIYADKPAFLTDPLFLRDANRTEVAKAREPEFRNAMRNSSAAKWYREHLGVAMLNLKKLQDAGVQVVMGTDTGPAYRFQGYFEHMELEYMTMAGLTPMQAIVAATATGARCLHAADQFGTLEAGKWADMIVLDANPLDDIRNTRKINSVWIAGNRVAIQTAPHQ
jgi:imidazolonepropionase-like amidohydrolase